ncbi:MAG: IclR family transcriptional regulator [Thermodesulfobacteriota bacterium]
MSQSLKKVAEILKCLSEGTHRFADICAAVGLPKSTVHRLLNFMIHSGFALQSPADRLYYLGPLIFSLTSNPVQTHQYLLTASREELKRLRNTTRETVAIHIGMGGYKMCLEEIESPERIRYAKGKGVVDSSYFGAAGKMLLAQYSDDDVQLLIEGRGTTRGDRESAAYLSGLRSELPKIRAQGYAESIGERTPGAASISVPITHYVRPLTLSVIAPEDRFREKRSMILKELRNASKRISKKLREDSALSG